MSKKCFIGGCAMNCGQYIQAVFDNIVKIGGLFDEYQIIIAYDESRDDTLAKLNEQVERFSKMGVKMVILTNRNPLIQSFRTINIANARNAIINKINQLNVDNWEYFIMMDLDDICSIQCDVSVLARYLNGSARTSKWDALSFNRDTYYDIWALSYEPYVYNCWAWQHPYKSVGKIKEEIKRKLDTMNPDELFECYSAFNGFAIYRCALFLNCRYCWKTRVFEAGLMRQNAIALNDIFINKPDDCEHRAFHLDAIHKNGARIRISPRILFSADYTDRPPV